MEFRPLNDKITDTDLITAFEKFETWTNSLNKGISDKKNLDNENIQK